MEENNKEEIEKIEVDEDLEIVKDVKSNETIMKEKVKDILKDLDNSEIVYKRKKRRKTILYTIGIIIEIIVIVFIVKGRYLNKNNNTTDDKVKMSVSCSNTVENSAYSASIKTTNIYYFNDDNEVIKRETEILYSFYNKDAYDRYKSDYIVTNIDDFRGVKEQSIFDDDNYLFKTKTTYTYSELKENKNVVFKNNIFTINMPNKEEITIPIENYDTVLTTNENMDFICE